MNRNKLNNNDKNTLKMVAEIVKKIFLFGASLIFIILVTIFFWTKTEETIEKNKMKKNFSYCRKCCVWYL